MCSDAGDVGLKPVPLSLTQIVPPGETAMPQGLTRFRSFPPSTTRMGPPFPLSSRFPTAARNKEGGNPTGVVFNSTAFFKVSLNGNSQPGLFIFVSEDGSISGWNPALDQTHAIIAVDNGTNKGSKRAIYKGVTLGVANGHNFLYVTNFHTGRVETYDENFHEVKSHRLC